MSKPWFPFCISVPLLLLSSCATKMHFQEPPREKFSYYTKTKSEMRIRTDGVYCYPLPTPKDTSGYTLIRFKPDGSVCLHWFNEKPSSLAKNREEMETAFLWNTQVNKGYYYFLNEVLKLEVLEGDPVKGYCFHYYDGGVDNDRLAISESNTRCYQKATREIIPYRLTTVERYSFIPDSSGYSGSATVYFKNSSLYNYETVNAVIQGTTVGFRNLRAGATTPAFKVRISGPGSNVSRFSVYLDSAHQESFKIEPMDFPSQVSGEKLGKSVYVYFISIHSRNDYLHVKLAQFDFPECKHEKHDSICRYGKKQDRPERVPIRLNEMTLPDAFKIRELHKAIPDSFKNESSARQWLYAYFFGDTQYDVFPGTDSVFEVKGDKLSYKLKDLHCLDLNGDGFPDFIYAPPFLRTTLTDHDSFDMYLNQRGGYKVVTGNGFITDVVFGKDGKLQSIRSFQGSCCTDVHNRFYEYRFDPGTDELYLTDVKTVLNCQLNEKKGGNRK